VEPVECELARSGRYMVHEQSVPCSSHGNMHYEHGHYHDHGHRYVVADPYDIRLDLDRRDDTSYEYDEQQVPVTYEQQLRKHGWRMELHGDPLNLKCVIATVIRSGRAVESF